MNRKPPSPLAAPSGLSNNVIPEESAFRMSPLSQVYSPNATSPYSQPHSNSPHFRQSESGSPTISSPSTRSSQTQSPVDLLRDPNQRLQDKIMLHLQANKDYKQNTSPNSSRTQSPVQNTTPQRVQSPLSHSPLASTPQHVISPTTQTPLMNHVPPPQQILRRAASSPSPSVSSSGTPQYRPIIHPNSAASNTQIQQYNKPTSQMSQPRRHSADIETVVSPHTPPAVPSGGLKVLPLAGEEKISQLRSAPLDTAVPQCSLRRMPGSRKRMPLSDMIMQRKIAESLKRSLSSGLKLSSPVGVIPSVQTNTPTSPRSTGPISPLSPTPVMSGGRTRSPSPPTPSYYMKAWQASEVAKSVATSSGPPLAVAQEPVRSQELPPRQKTRGDDVPPERPPKSRALFIEKL